MELSGDYREPAEEDILRTGGDPEDGARNGGLQQYTVASLADAMRFP